MELWKKIVLSITAVLVVGYLLFSFFYYKESRQEPVCHGMAISFSDADQRQFVSAEEISQFIARSGLNPVGEPLSPRRCHNIEQQALQHPMIRHARCYSRPDGYVQLTLTQRIPMLRVLGGDSYFVDTDRRIMPVRSTTASDIPIVTGRVSQRMATEELFDFIEWLEDDSFWRDQVVQINVVTPQQIELIPRVGDGVILLGSLDGYKGKLKKLKSLYQDGFAKFGWKEYNEIDLRYRGQVVCR